MDFPDFGPPWITTFADAEVASKINGSRRISKGRSISPSGQRHCCAATPERCSTSRSGIGSSSGGSHSCGARGP
ncbi:hypothetical protein C6A87_002265 [Mycobacterium sp. ITM-2016-00317]|nr:hypothetical protein [Mycobacterium sp. ITM-2016-00317]WNG90562.1 hypothetical protein C6A87_002265 [Mycobacterium sp. ITM-2016-00317]